MTKPWFKSIVLKTRGQHLQTFAKMERSGKPLPRLRGARLVDMDSWPYPRAGVKISFMGNMDTFYTTRDWIKIFDIDKTTVYRWQKLGLIPEPVFAKANRYNLETKFYIRGQLTVVSKIVNDLRRQGILRFRKDTIQYHLDMLKVGNAQAIERWHKVRENRGKKRKIRWKA
jgi:hypothetical protein